VWTMKAGSRQMLVELRQERNLYVSKVERRIRAGSKVDTCLLIVHQKAQATRPLMTMPSSAIAGALG
jgi:hypothetical protein